MLCFFSTQHGVCCSLLSCSFLAPRGALAFCRACTGALMGPLKALNAIRSYARARHNKGKGLGVSMPEALEAEVMEKSILCIPSVMGVPKFYLLHCTGNGEKLSCSKAQRKSKPLLMLSFKRNMALHFD